MFDKREYLSYRTKQACSIMVTVTTSCLEFLKWIFPTLHVTSLAAQINWSALDCAVPQRFVIYVLNHLVIAIGAFDSIL